MSEKFENKLINRNEEIMGLVLKDRPSASANYINTMNEEQLVEYETKLLDELGKDGWFYSGYRVLGPKRILYYIFTRVTEDDTA